MEYTSQVVINAITRNLTVTLCNRAPSIGIMAGCERQNGIVEEHMRDEIACDFLKDVVSVEVDPKDWVIISDMLVNARVESKRMKHGYLEIFVSLIKKETK